MMKVLLVLAIDLLITGCSGVPLVPFIQKVRLDRHSLSG